MATLPEEIRNVTPQIVPASIPVAFFISLVVGVVFGIFPAIRAAKMNPIDALRHE
jgi:ABC-type antimicrobial peptide transport system permease subunit